ncbi:MAG TPA: hypothetical protein PKZ84_03775, partial [Anaerolineae bacterium]|nr:hypothetical protein [Anaerolineae bacterium]HQI86039.1 hypothetical protein [Anaerolineae bacterium]
MNRFHCPLFRWLNVGVLLTLLLSPFTVVAQAAPLEAPLSPSTASQLLPTWMAEEQTPPPTTGVAPATPGVSTVTAPSPNCALLDDPTARGMISGALETALLHACGREATARVAPTFPLAVAPTSSLSVAPTPHSLFPMPSLPTALGDDVLVNDPTGDMTSMTQSGAVIARNEDNGILCAAYNDSYHGTVEGTGWVGFSSSGDGGATWSDHGSL